ncbi:peptidoglycan-binding domain-containing protein [Oceaniglobus ichthyenteri]|uniref:peptidoglycan-binding domain-containing protein n=1 Tax=Oceaniglobus ichthyenteri TaxID=2136177 RepID=UPI000D3BE628|nr:peptidoglycan-binding domain-containing protein [Oceaniglobus ichthyenteri]
MTRNRVFTAGIVGCAIVALAGCAPMAMPDVSRFQEPELKVVDAPANTNPNACYSSDITPATVETVTEQVLVQPAEVSPDGTVLRPASYRTETETRIIKDRSEIVFETVCEKDLTPQFVASLQRALAVRGLYTGPVTSEMNAETRRAVRRFQNPEGLHSSVLSVAAAKRLGLAVYSRDEALATRR